MKRFSFCRSILAIVAVLAGAGLANAATFNFSTAGATGTCAPAGSGSAQISGSVGSAENALATVTTNNGSITVTLTNCLANPKDVTQVITDVFFYGQRDRNFFAG